MIFLFHHCNYIFSTYKVIHLATDVVLTTALGKVHPVGLFFEVRTCYNKLNSSMRSSAIECFRRELRPELYDLYMLRSILSL